MTGAPNTARRPNICTTRAYNSARQMARIGHRRGASAMSAPTQPSAYSGAAPRRSWAITSSYTPLVRLSCQNLDRYAARYQSRQPRSVQRSPTAIATHNCVEQLVCGDLAWDSRSRSPQTIMRSHPIKQRLCADAVRGRRARRRPFLEMRPGWWDQRAAAIRRQRRDRLSGVEHTAAASADHMRKIAFEELPRKSWSSYPQKRSGIHLH